ncbi:MAG: 1-phosphofructokinase [Lachnospiraceae bacterium]|nr:1-phosphofructokinase [Lachnospiraceae bacterium]
MIYTVTFNPSLDYIVNVEHFQTGRVNRTTKELVYPGGKGINVSMVLKNLGCSSTALGFVAGFTGKEIERALKELGCITDFIHLEKGNSRINIKLRSDKESEINGQGPDIGEKAIQALYKQLDTLSEGDILVLAGSIPAGMSSTAYEEILDRIGDKKIKTVVDASGDLLTKVLPYHPFLIKPNHHELEEIFHTKIETREKLIAYGHRLQAMGAANVLISLAGEGAVFIAENGEILSGKAPNGNLVNSVGAGDSMVAGFLTGYMQSSDYKTALQWGIATGSASAFSEELAKRDEVEKLLQSIYPLGGTKENERNN